VRYEEIRAPKVPFSREEPNFKAASTVISHDPNVLLAQSELSVQKSQINYAVLVRKLIELKDKIGASEVYLSILNEISSLPTSKQAEIEDFVIKNEKKLKSIVASEAALSASKDVKEATAALDVEIKHWELLNKEKGKVTLKSFRPTERKVSEELPILKIMPKIGGPASVDDIARLDKHGVIIKTPGYGENPPIDQVISAKPKDQEYYIKYMSKLPDQAYFAGQRNKYFKEGSLQKKAEKNVMLSKQYEWKSLQLTNDIDTLQAKFTRLQNEIATSIAKLPNQKITIGLGIAVMAKPATFRSGMLLDNLRTVIANTTLGGFGDALPAITVSGKEEIKTRTNVLTGLQTQLITEPPDLSPTAPIKQKSLLGLALGIGLLLLLLRRK